MNRLARFHVPYPNRFVEGARNDEVRLGVKIDAEDEVGVAAESFDAFGGACSPNAEGAVVRSGADVGGVGGPGQVGDAVGVTDEAGNLG